MADIRAEVLRAKRGEPGAFEGLLDGIDGTLHRMAQRLAPGLDEDDTCQIATIKIWTELPKINTRRTAHAVQAMVLTIAANAMRDAVRGDKKRRPVPFTDVPKEGRAEPIHMLLPARSVTMPAHGIDRGLSPILKQYLKYVRHTKRLSGAHKAVGEQNKISPVKAAQLFDEHAKRYRSKNKYAE
jgi:hypothetical protein